MKNVSLRWRIRALEFEKAALLRDEIVELRKVLASGKEPEQDSRMAARKL
ncbi:MAG: UvrB/UvrC motif-containing protein [Chloroflexi bacterium]|nr:UvrB/UvrC motif-containing protein [Chloroflexota bacterium]